MAEAQEDVCKNSEISANLEKMLNNKRYGDTVFLVNKRKFYASSHLVSVSSVELESMLETHYENCEDREIRIGEVTYNESFSVILRFIYGLDIDLPQLNKAVLCEVLTLAERFELKSFSSKLKSYLSKHDCFQVDFLVVFLNTAKKFQMIDLYEKLTFYAYENADQLVKCEDFGELQYDVLLDLVKANFFCTDEIDILKGVLNWHGNNMSNSPSTENDIEAVIDKDTTDEEDDSKEKKNMVLQKRSNRMVNNDNLGHQSQSTVKTEELMKEFSTNVLKSLLTHVRFSRVSAVEIYKLMETELYTKFKEFLCDSKYFSPSSEPRIKYVAIPPVQFVENDIKDISEKFTVTCPQQGQMYESNEEHVIGNMKWKICVKYNITPSTNNYTLDVYLKCMMSDELFQDKEWECNTVCQLKMIPNQQNYPIIYLPGTNANLSLKLTSDNSRVDIGNFYFSTQTWLYSDNTTYTFDLNFKSIHSKVKIEQ